VFWKVILKNNNTRIIFVALAYEMKHRRMLLYNKKLLSTANVFHFVSRS